MTAGSKHGRCVSLDVFRGVAILLMILVNNQTGPSVFGCLQHAGWTGVTMADLAFPFFLFAAGASMWLSGQNGGGSGGRFWGRVIRRVLVLCAVGLLLNWFPFQEPFHSLRFSGVLQRIAVSGLLAAIIIRGSSKSWRMFVGLLVLVGGYWLLIYTQGEGIVARIDLQILGANHMYTPRFDPEGVLSTVSATATVLLGYLSGRIVARNNVETGALPMLGFGLLVGFAGWGWNYLWPMSKPLWNGSYILFTAGIAMVLWSLLSVVIDHLRAQGWAKLFVVAGTNSLWIYVISILLGRTFSLLGVTQAVYEFFRSCQASPAVASLLYSVLMALVCLLFTWPLYRKGLFVRA